MAICRASTTSSERMWSAIDQPDDLAGEHVEDRAAVDLPGSGGVLGDVGAPQQVRAGGDEPALHQVLVDRRSRPVPALVPVADPAPAERSAAAGRPVCGRPGPAARAAARHAPAGRRRSSGSRGGCRRWCWPDRRPRGPGPRVAGYATRSSPIARPSRPGRPPRRRTRRSASSWTSRNPILGARSPGRSRRWPASGSRSPSPAAGSPGAAGPAPPARPSTGPPCGRCRRRPGPSSAADPDSLIPRSFAICAIDAPGCRARSTARRRNSGGCGAGIHGLLSCSDHRLRSGVRATGSGSRRLRYGLRVHHYGRTSPRGRHTVSVDACGRSVTIRQTAPSLLAPMNSSGRCERYLRGMTGPKSLGVDGPIHGRPTVRHRTRRCFEVG